MRELTQPRPVQVHAKQMVRSLRRPRRTFRHLDTPHRIRSAVRGDGHGIYLLDAFGNRELLYRDPTIGCLGPVPVKPRPVPPVIPAASEPARQTEQPSFRTVGDEHPLVAAASERAVVRLINVYDSLYPFPAEVKIRALRIVHLLPNGDRAARRLVAGQPPCLASGGDGDSS